MKKLVIVVMLVGAFGAESAFSQTESLYPTVPGTNVRDYSQPGVIGQTSGATTVFYLTIPGTNVRDYSDFGPSAVAKTYGGKTTLYPTILGTNLRDYSQFGVTVESFGSTTTAYPTYPGTGIRDYSQPGAVAQSYGGAITIYPTYPGTSVRDYSQPGVLSNPTGDTTTFYPTIPGTSVRDYSQLGAFNPPQPPQGFVIDPPTANNVSTSTPLFDPDAFLKKPLPSKTTAFGDPIATSMQTTNTTPPPGYVLGKTVPAPNPMGDLPVSSPQRNPFDQFDAVLSPQQNVSAPQTSLLPPHDPLWSELPKWRQAQLIQKYPDVPNLPDLYNQQVIERNPEFVPATPDLLMRLASQGVMPKVVNGVLDMNDVTQQLARRTQATAPQGADQ